jgi:GNAT superfamily N-acetyltransferase
VSPYSDIEPLAAEHDTSTFECGSDAQTTWLRRHAVHAHRAGTSRVYVATLPGASAVVGYHALAAGSVSVEEAPPRIGAGVGRHPVPVIVLTRLGVDVSEHGRGLGRLLVRDALQRVAAAADIVGLRALLIHAESDAARSFYAHLAEFEASPTDPLHLYLLIKDLRASLR